MKLNFRFLLITAAFVLALAFGLFKLEQSAGPLVAIAVAFAVLQAPSLLTTSKKLGANVLSSLAADIYRAADIVGREQVGFIPSVTLNTDAGVRVALNDTVRSFFTRTPTVGTITPSMTTPEGTDQTVDTKTLSVTQTASVKIPWTGEDIKHVNNGSGFSSIYGDQIAQAMRAIVNQIESYLGGLLANGASRAYGTAGTTPFASNFNEVAQLRKILVDNGTPMDGRTTLVINSLAGVNLRNLAQLQKVNEAGSSTLLRQGELLNLQGIAFKESAGVNTHTAGTGAGFLLNGAAAVKDTALIVDTGTGTLLAGDVITIAGDTNKYVLGIDGTLTLATINTPGLLVAGANNTAVTVGAGYTANVAFHQAAVELVVRPMATPQGGDAAIDVLTVQDPHSGLVFDIRAYKGYMKAMFDVQCVYGGKVWKPDFVATLLG
jgi:hypothetical protein